MNTEPNTLEMTCTGPTGASLLPTVAQTYSPTAQSTMIMVENRSSVVSDAQVEHVISALQTQLDRDWQPIWGTTACVKLMTPMEVSPQGAWKVILEDTTDYANTLGYHTQDYQGTPLGKVFVGDSSVYGYTWSNTFSHEVLEMMADPYVNLCVFDQYTMDMNRLWSYEVCDPCEHEDYSYLIDDVLVSDFVYPWWFSRNSHMTKYDHMGKIHKPFEILPGGYMSVYDVRPGAAWQTVYAPSLPNKFRMHSPINNRKLRGVK